MIRSAAMTLFLFALVWILLVITSCQGPSEPTGPQEITVRPQPEPAIEPPPPSPPEPITPYPIHVNFVGDVPDGLRDAVEVAATMWSNILSPTRAAPFTFHTDADVCAYFRDHPEELKLKFRAGETLDPG